MSSRYLVILFLCVVWTGFFDSFATQFRGTMSTYVRESFQVPLGEIVGRFKWLFLGSCFAFIPRSLADIVGRKPMLVVTLTGLCVFQWMTSFARSPSEYVLLLTLLALFYKSDIWLLMIAEDAPAKHRGLVIAASTAVGGFGAVALGALVAQMGDDPDAWRGIARTAIWGVVGVVPFVLFLREPTGFKARRREPMAPAWRSLLFEPFVSSSRLPLIVMMLLKGIYPGFLFVVVLLIGTEFLRVDNGFSPSVIGTIIQIDVLASMMAWVLAGHLSDRIGRKICVYGFGCLFACSVFTLALVPAGSFAVMAAFVAQSFAATGTYAALRIATVELFPSGHRATGSAWTDLFMTLSAAVTAMLIGTLTDQHGSDLSLQAILVTVGLLAPCALPLCRLLPETRQRQLGEI